MPDAGRPYVLTYTIIYPQEDNNKQMICIVALSILFGVFNGFLDLFTYPLLN